MFGNLRLLGIAIVVVIASAAAQAIEKVTVGNTKTVVKTVTGTFEKNLRRLTLRDDVYHNELIKTGIRSATEIIFVDETRLVIGPNSRMTLDRFVFDPDPDRAAFVMTAVRGVFRFASGKLPKKSYLIRTPAATIGIRGTILTIEILPLASKDRGEALVVNITVESGTAVVVNCFGERVVLTGPRSSMTIFRSAAGECSAAKPPPGRPARLSSHVYDLERLLQISQDHDSR